MTAAQAKMPKRGAVRAQLVGRQQFRREAVLPEQLAHQPECRVLVAAALHQHIENLALVIDGAPQVHPFACDASHGGFDGETVHTMDYLEYAYLQLGQDAKAKQVVDELLG